MHDLLPTLAQIPLLLTACVRFLKQAVICRIGLHSYMDAALRMVRFTFAQCAARFTLAWSMPGSY